MLEFRASGSHHTNTECPLGRQPQPPESSSGDVLVEGLDYYVEDGLYVFTAHYLLKRGYCCQSGCRHCPYGFKDGRVLTNK